MKRLVIDTETTGLSPRFNKVLTVGLLLVDVEKNFINFLDSKHVFIKHDEYNANPFALRINKIDLKKHHRIGIEPKKACNQINRFVAKNALEKTILLGHNHRFDKNFLEILFQQGNSKPKFSGENEDTMQIWKILKNQNKVPLFLRNNLKTVSEYFHVDNSNAHDALGDCEITAKVYHKMMPLIFQKTF